nr:tetratricopeptide repeat protein [Gemmatimonadales bacterium]
VLTRASVRDILGLMERPAESVVPFELAREIATREGAKAVLDGEIVRLGRSFVVSARLVSALDGQELATFRETAADEDRLIGALGELSRAVRERAGESLRTIRASSELERVTTPSLAALRKYVEGSALADESGEIDRGLALLEEAVALDTAFAMAWRKIAVLLGNEERDRARAIAAVVTAYRHRSRLTEMERLLTVGYYYTRGPEPNGDKALAAYEEAIRLDSTSTSALNNAGVVYGEKRDYERAEAVYRRVVALPHTFGGAFTNLVQEQIRNGRLSALDSTVAAFRARFPESNDLWEAEWYAVWGRGEIDRADSIGRAVFTRARTSRQAIRAAAATADLAAMRGRWREGLRWWTRRSEAMMRALPSTANRLNFALDTAQQVAMLDGDVDRTRAVIARGLALYPLDSISPADRPWDLLSDIGATIGDPAMARQALAGFERDGAPTARDPMGRRALYSAHVALAERRWDDAVDLLHEADRRTTVFPRYALVQIGRAHDRAGRPDSAIVYYERFLGTPDPQPMVDASWRAPTHRWLGELYEARGDARKAIEQYSRFVELWSEADPELQPQVAEVRSRLGRLRAKVG